MPAVCPSSIPLSRLTVAQASAQLSQILQALTNPQAVAGVDPQAALNHLWVYIDRA